MRVKYISFLILALCLLSVVVGLLNVNKGKYLKKACPASSKNAFLGKFSAGGNKIALITLQGAISNETASNFLGDSKSADSVLKAIKKASADKTVKGVLFRINSPGGTVAMSQEIYSSVMKLREKKPVVVSMADIAASGGYYVACAADRIYANPGTLTGSIGVILETVNVKGLLTDKLGIKSEVIKSGKFKDTGSPYRPLRDDERELLNNLVLNAYGQFVDAITQGRINRKDNYKIEKIDLNKENLEKYADGRIFSGEQALEYGFVDKLGGLAQATEDIKKMANEPEKTPVVDYTKSTGIGDFWFNISESNSSKLENLLPLSRKFSRQPLYIWE